MGMAKGQVRDGMIARNAKRNGKDRTDRQEVSCPQNGHGQEKIMTLLCVCASIIIVLTLRRQNQLPEPYGRANGC
jgi:hypothetical protein